MCMLGRIMGARMRFHPGLMCEAVSLSYDFETRTGQLVMAPENSCDMNTCVALFRKIDEKVQRIVTFAGGVADLSFRLGSSGWEIEDHRDLRKVASPWPLK